jgi:phosphate transport system substrate-binding protein
VEENKMKKRILIFVTTIALVAGLSINAFAGETLTLSGSTALLPIIKTAATEFMAKNPDVTIQVAGGGSGTGLTQAQNGTVNIGDSDVYATEGSGLVDHQVCIEPFLFVTNQSVLIPKLTHDQIVAIFSGKITNWKDVGGKNQKIVVIMRAASSGTRMTIQSLVMGNEQFTKNGIVQDSAGAVRTTVARTPGAIGYLDLSYVSTMTRPVKYEGIAPTIENVKNGTHKLISIGHMYTKGEATGSAKAFIEYIQSKDFQNRVLLNYQFVPIAALNNIDVKKVESTKK